MAIARRAFIAGTMAALAALPLAAKAEDWPSGPTRIIAPFPAGGSVDAVARLLAPGLSERLKANVIVENIAGASGSIGAAAAARAEPDAKTWLLVFDTHAVNPSLMPDLPFDSKTDLVPVFLVGTAPNVVAAHPSHPYNNLGDVIEAAKKEPEAITYGSIGTGSLGHLTVALLSNKAGVKLTHVPYKGGGPAVTDAIGGHVDLVVGSAALLNPQIKAGKLKPVVQTGKTRLAALPNVQTAIEAGFPGFESYAWWGVFVPKGTPQPYIDKFVAALQETLEDEKVVKHLTEAQQMTILKGGPEELKAFFNEQVDTWGKVIKDNGIKPSS